MRRSACSSVIGSSRKSLPATREATLVHAIDNLGGKLGSFDRLQKVLPDGETWSPFDRALAGSAYFAASGSAEPEAELASAR